MSVYNSLNRALIARQTSKTIFPQQELDKMEKLISDVMQTNKDEKENAKLSNLYEQAKVHNLMMKQKKNKDIKLAKNTNPEYLSENESMGNEPID